MTRKLYSEQMLQASEDGLRKAVQERNDHLARELRRLYALEAVVRVELDRVPEPAAGRIRRALEPPA